MAIAFNVHGQQVSTATTNTVSITPTSGTDLLIVFVGIDGGDTPTALTWNGTSLLSNLIATATMTATPHVERAYYLAAPAVGTFNLSLTRTGSAGNSSYLHANFYSGAKQTGQPDASSTTVPGGTSNTLTQTLTTIADNSWATCVYVNDSSVSQSAGTNSTIRGTALNNAVGCFDSNGPKTPAGSFSMTQNAGGTGNQAGIMVSFSPAVASVSSPDLRLAFI